jgi:hypothetical protein
VENDWQYVIIYLICIEEETKDKFRTSGQEIKVMNVEVKESN